MTKVQNINCMRLFPDSMDSPQYTKPKSAIEHGIRNPDNLFSHKGSSSRPHGKAWKILPYNPLTSVYFFHHTKIFSYIKNLNDGSILKHVAKWKCWNPMNSLLLWGHRGVAKQAFLKHWPIQTSQHWAKCQDIWYTCREKTRIADSHMSFLMTGICTPAQNNPISPPPPPLVQLCQKKVLCIQQGGIGRLWRGKWI